MTPERRDGLIYLMSWLIKQRMNHRLKKNGCAGCPMQIRILISVQEWKLPIEEVFLRTAHIRLLMVTDWQQTMQLLFLKDIIMLRRHLTHE